MNLEKFSESAYLYLLDEMNAEERIEFENILMQDDLLKQEFDRIKADIALFEEAKPVEISETELTSLRNNLFRTIRIQEPQDHVESLKNKIRRIFLHNYGLAFGGIATFVFGIGIGYMLLFSRAATNSLKLETPIEVAPSQKTEIIDESQKALPESASSEVEKTTENQTTIVSGSFEDVSVKRALIAALLGQNNPGVRIKSISTLADHAEREAYKPDVKIKNALIKSMKKDSNPVVRSEALNILKKYPFDNEIRDALLYVLANDKNPGLRVSAINALTDIKLQGILIDEVVKQVLTKRVEADKNKFVKYRAASILKEVE